MMLVDGRFQEMNTNTFLFSKHWITPNSVKVEEKVMRYIAQMCEVRSESEI